MSSDVLHTDKAFQNRIDASRTHIVKAVFPFTANHHGTLFGGHALSWMDETAFIAATHFSRKRLVTLSSDSVAFTQPIPEGSMVELIAEVVYVGRTSLKVQVSAYVEDMYQDGIEKAIDGVFSFVAIGDDKKPIPVLEGLT